LDKDLILSVFAFEAAPITRGERCRRGATCEKPREHQGEVMPYRVSYPGGAYVSSTPIGRHDYVRADRSYTAPAGYVSAGPQPHSADTFSRYLHGVAAGRYHAGYANYLNGHGVIKPR
jgi:hypothetical protein